MQFDVEKIRQQFPALHLRDRRGNPRVYFDGPAGTQVPQQVMNAMTDYLVHSNANTHGQFETAQATDELIWQARAAVADLLGAPSPQNIVFGANMTTLTFHLSRAIGRALTPGEEIIVTRLDHDANIAPWLALQEFGIRVRWLPFDLQDGTLRLEELYSLITPQTRLIAVGYASNALGTINPVKEIVSFARERGIWTFLDAVHYAPHGLIDVQELGCNFLACSAYKFYGPHVGCMFIADEAASRLQPDRVRPQEPTPPDCFETGTLNHEGLAGVIAAVDYLAGIPQLAGGADASFGSLPRRERLKRAMAEIHEYEQTLSRALLNGFREREWIRVYGIADPERLEERVPTFGIRIDGHSPQETARALGARGIFVWDGDFFAMEPVKQLGLAADGGLVRIGAVHYNTIEEVQLLLAALDQLQ